MTERERIRIEEAKTAYMAFMKFYPLSLEDLDGEQWADIAGYEGLYQVSTFGRVRRFFKNGNTKILSPIFTRFGYLRVDLCKNNRPKHWFIHRLVALAFLPNIGNKPEVNHVDGHPLNCCVANLEWVTTAENERHAWENGFRIAPRSEESHFTKLTKEQAFYVKENPDKLTLKALAKKFNVSQATISLIQRGETWRMLDSKVREKLQVPSDIRKKIKSEYQKGVRGFSTRALAKKYEIGVTTVRRILSERG